MAIETMILDGRKRIVMDPEDYEDLIDARDHAHAVREVATGVMPTLSDAELEDYLSAATPLAFWRGRSGKTQDAVAEEVGLSQHLLAQIEAGRRVASATMLAKIARALSVRIEELIA